MKIIVADDHAVVRKGLKQILLEISGVKAVEEVDNGPALIERITKENFDFVILDISMPGQSGLLTLKEIKDRKPKLPVLILSIHPEEQYALRSLRDGASGYLTKDSAPEELVRAIQKILSGHKYITQTLADKLVNNFGDKLPHELLSDREYEVFSMIAVGKTMTGIADELSLSVKTVSTYRSRIYDKMDMKSRTEITLYAIHNELIK
ncbi:MAG: DNA-binding response regulator [Ignavibacteriae bacterium]|nr:MAG: DNA-binding response regulator [Ignavibacteriota bacterium]